MAEGQLRWPETKGFYTKYELGRLCSCLGYPNDIFLNCLHGLARTKASLRSECLKCLAGNPFSERTVKQLLEYKPLLLRLEKRFNRYDSKYNVKVIRKAMWLLRHQKMSFDEISDCRIAFEVYSCEDDSGLPADVDTVLSAFKMVDKIISPSKLECEIQKQQHVVDIPSRIQLYEFLSLVPLAHRTSDVDSEMNSDDANCMDDQDSSDVSLPDLNRILMTSDQKKIAYLDQKYKQSLYREVHPTPFTMDTEHTVSAAVRRNHRALAREQFRVLSPSLELSQSQLHQVRGGRVVLSREQYRAVESGSRQPSPSRIQESVQRSKWASRRGKLQSPSKDLLGKLTREEKGSVTSIGQEEPVFRETGCIKAVLKARKALQTSLCSIPQQRQTSSSTDSLLKPETLDPLLHRPSTAPELGVGGGGHPWHFQPVVTSEELKEQQGRISDLRWASLRLSPKSVAPASSKVCISRFRDEFPNTSMYA